jgi:hypothetical protein
VPAGKVPGPEETRNPRERIILTDLPASADQDYRIRIRVKKGKFTGADRIRVLLSPKREAYFDPQTNSSTPAVRFLDASGKGELFPPADNPLVLTVGEINPSCAHGPTADHRVKPDVILPDSRALFSNGEMTLGTSNSAAYFAGVVALMKAAEPRLHTRHLLWFAHYGKSQKVAIGRDGMPIPMTRSSSSDRMQPMRNPGMPVGGTPIVTSYARRPAPGLPPRPVLSSGIAASTAARSIRQLRVWQTPTLLELKEEVQQDR